jgi:hypothetical protein
LDDEMMRIWKMYFGQLPDDCSVSVQLIGRAYGGLPARWSCNISSNGENGDRVSVSVEGPTRDAALKAGIAKAVRVLNA